MAVLNKEQRVLKIIRELLSLEDDVKITRDTHFERHLTSDSLTQLEVLMALEDEFKIDIDDEQAGEFITIGNVIHYIEQITPVETND